MVKTYDIREKTFFMNACINGDKDVVRLPFSKCDLRVLKVGWVFHHLLCARWWETHLYVIIIKYQNDLRLVSHSNHSSAKFWGPMKFSIIVPSSSSRVGGKGKTFTPTSWFTIRSPYSFGWCYSRVLRLQLPSTCMPHFRSRSYLCTQHDYPLSAPQLLAETESS